MSASNSPPNPGQPKSRISTPPRPSALRRFAPSLIAGGAALTLLYTYFATRAAPAPNPFRTPGVKNIERAYRGAGATGTHTPAYGGTRQGQRDDERFRGEAEGTLHGEVGLEMKSAGKRTFNHSGPNGGGGPDGSGSESRDIGEVQRPRHGQSNGVGKMWNRFKYENEDQK